MPMTFTDEMVLTNLRRAGLSDVGTIEECRERYAKLSEDKYGDYVQGWEVRTGRPWNTMSRWEAEALVEKHPQLLRNPGVLSRLMS